MTSHNVNNQQDYVPTRAEDLKQHAIFYLYSLYFRIVFLNEVSFEFKKLRNKF